MFDQVFANTSYISAAVFSIMHVVNLSRERVRVYVKCVYLGISIRWECVRWVVYIYMFACLSTV